jgi:hypothetical protein
VVGLVLVWVVVGLPCWLGYQLIVQNGRLLLRLEALEGRLGVSPAPDAQSSAGLPVKPYVRSERRTAGTWEEGFFAFHGMACSGQKDGVMWLHSAVDPHEYEVTRRIVRAGDRVLSAGHGMGSIATLLAAQLGRENVISYEANPILVDLAMQGIAFASGPPLLYWGALGIKDGEIELHLGHRWAESSCFPAWAPHQSYGKTIKVPLVDTNRIIRDHRVNVLVLDIEQSECDILPVLDYEPLRAISVELHGGRADEMIGHMERGGLELAYRITVVPNSQEVVAMVRPDR